MEMKYPVMPKEVLESNLLDHYAGIALRCGKEPQEAWRIALAMMEERRRIKEHEQPSANSTV